MKGLVKPNDFELVIVLWLSKASLVDVFSSLPAVKKSKRKVRLEAWLHGDVPSEDWNRAFDQFIEFATGAIGDYLPWLFRASAALCEIAGGPVTAFYWRTAALELEQARDQDVDEHM